MNRPDTAEEAAERMMDLARYFYWLQRRAENKVRNTRSARSQDIYDLEASVYAECASDAREVALWLDGEMDTPPMSIEIGDSAAAPAEEDGLANGTEIEVEGDDAED